VYRGGYGGGVYGGGYGGADKYGTIAMGSLIACQKE